MHRGNGLQRLQNVRITDIARMDDQLGTSQRRYRFGPQQAVRI